MQLWTVASYEGHAITKGQVAEWRLHCRGFRLQTQWESANQKRKRTGTRTRQQLSCVTKRDPCAYENQKLMRNENDEGNTDACAAGSQRQEAKRPKSDEAREKWTRRNFDCMGCTCSISNRQDPCPCATMNSHRSLAARFCFAERAALLVPQVKAINAETAAIQDSGIFYRSASAHTGIEKNATSETRSIGGDKN